jgi:drug/metabolite transporter (DMT)-like permease
MPINATVAGVGLGVLAYGLFAVHDAAIKLLVETLPVWQILFFRSATILIVCLAIGRTGLLRRAVETPLKRALAIRSVITMTAWLCYYTAARSMGLGQLLTLYFAAPIIVTILAARVLHEAVTPVRWTSVGVGFVGVLFAADPFGVTVEFGTLLVLIAAALWGTAIILMRLIAQRESSLLQMLANNTVFLLCTGAACFVSWRTPGWGELALLLAVGGFGGLAQFLVFEMARRTPASVMSTVEYSALIWAFLLGYLIWGDIPSIWVWVGAGLIAAAGALLVLGESRRRKTA